MPSGTRLGPFEIVGPIGAGGMGEVYHATDTRLKRAVALKVLPDAFAGDPDRMARVQREAEVLASLNHPHIAHLYGIERHEGSAAPFLVMELVEGEDLAARVSRGPIPLADALPIAGQVAEALEAAHEKGVIHRDLKPGNIMVTPDGVVKVLDFGLAKALDPVDLSRSANLAASPTLTAASLPGVILGTAAYMAPEQAKGKVVDKRADIWAFGCVLFEVLTGRRAFEGDDVSETLAFVLTKEPAWKLLPADMPSEVGRLLRRCLEKDPKRRLRDIGEARIALDNTSVPESAVAPSAAVGKERTLQRVLWPLATAILIATLSIVSFVHFREIAPEARIVTSNLVAPDDTTYDFEGFGPPALSPDGRSIAFVVRSSKGVPQLWMRRLDSPAARLLAERAAYPFWSPDSRFVAFGALVQLKKVDVTGGPPVVIARMPNNLRGGSWSPSGDIIFGVTGNNRPLFRVPAAGGEPVPATATQSHGKPAGRRMPWFLPDGRHFLYNSTWGADESCICVGTLGEPDGPETQVAATTSQGIFADGHLMYVRDDTLLAQPFDAARLTTTGDPQLVQTGVATQGFPRAAVFSVASGGWLVYQPVWAATGMAGQQQLTWLDRAGRVMSTLGSPGQFGDIGLSPDRTLLGATRNDSSGSNDLWLYDIARGIPTRFTTDGASDQETVWSPDGRTIFWRSARQGAGDLFRKASDFSGGDELVYASAQSKRPSSVSPDGRFLLFNNTPTEEGDLWLLQLPSGSSGASLEPRPFLQTPAGEGLGQFSPDGGWVAYQSNESGVQEIYATPFPGPGTKVQISIDGGTQPRWRRDGKEIFYLSLQGQLSSTEVALEKGSLVAGRTEKLFSSVVIVVNRGYLWDVSADGQRFIAALGDTSKPSPLTLVQNWTRALK